MTHAGVFRYFDISIKVTSTSLTTPELLYDVVSLFFQPSDHVLSCHAIVITLWAAFGRKQNACFTDEDAPKLLSTHEGSDDDVPAGLDAAVRSQQNAVSQPVVKECAVYLSQTLSHQKAQGE